MLRNTILLFVMTFASQSVQALPMKWMLNSEYGNTLGAFLLDFTLPPKTSEVFITGDFSTYTVPSWALLDINFYVGPELVNDYFRFFSTETGKVYRSESGPDDYNEIRINDSSIEIGTLAGPLMPEGGTFNVIVNEIYNYDETYQFCYRYEEIYDEVTGEYIGQGNCELFDTYTYYNIDAGYWYYGTLTSVAASIPLPATLLLMTAGLAVLGLTQRKHHSTTPALLATSHSLNARELCA